MNYYVAIYETDSLIIRERYQSLVVVASDMISAIDAFWMSDQRPQRGERIISIVPVKRD